MICDKMKTIGKHNCSKLSMRILVVQKLDHIAEKKGRDISLYGESKSYYLEKLLDLVDI